MKKSLLPFALLLSGLFFYACGTEPKQPEPTPSEKAADELGKSIEKAFEGVEGGGKDLKDALKEMGTAIEKNANKDIVIVPFRQMKELFPERIAGLNKVDKGEGSTTQVFGINVSNYEVYYGDKSNKVKIQMIDTGGVGAALMGAVAWSSMKIDKETKEGYEMTTEYKGHKAFEKFNENSKTGSLAILAADRFVVNIEGEGLPMKKLKEIRDEIDLDKLISLGKQ
jgi:hypothetical protein